MRRLRRFTVAGLLTATALAITGPLANLAGTARAADADQRRLIRILESDAPKAEKAITCKRLAIYGNAQAVPALAALLPDAQLASWARIALEAIPDPAAGAALRDAMDRLDGRLLIGVINSIGVRRDARSVDALAERLKDNDQAVASAAAVALGRIAGQRAVAYLQPLLAAKSRALRSAAAEGCVLCAERLLKAGKTAEAVALYDAVRRAEVPEQRVIEATRGAILARGDAGVPLLVDQLRSTKRRRFQLGLTVAREMPAMAVTEAIVGELDGAPPSRQVLLIRALADRGDRTALPAVLEAARRGPATVRLVALDVLRRIGDASTFSPLLEIAVGAKDQVGEAARAAIAGLPDHRVDTALLARAAQGRGEERVVLIDLIGRRRLAEGTDLLVRAADDPDPRVRRAALVALGATAGPEQLPLLIARVVAPRHAEDVQAAEDGLRAASVRMPNREKCAAELAAAAADAPPRAKRALVEILAAVGGTNGLAGVAEAARDKHPEVRDAAIRLLGQWMTVEAGPVLLELAKTAPESKYRIRALRGYLRIARQFVLPMAERARMCRAALETAERNDERVLVLQILQRYPSVEMLELAVEAAKQPGLETEAAKTARAIAKKIGPNKPRVRKLIAQLDQVSAAGTKKKE